MSPALELDTPRLALRTMKMGDFEELLQIFTDPLVMASFGGVIFNRGQMSGWIQRNLGHQEEYGYGLFSVILKSENRLIGDCGLEHMTLDGVRETELGYDFKSRYWNQGYATEAACAVRDYAFGTLHLPRLISLIRVGNLSSSRVAEKVGMHLMGELTENDIQYWKYAIEDKSRGQSWKA